METLDKYIFKGHIEQGVIHPLAPRTYKQALEALEGRNVWITLEPLFGDRTVQQNKYYWGVVIAEIIRWKSGYTAVQMHETLKDMFLAQEDLTMAPYKGRYFHKQVSTRTLSTVEFMNYLDQIILWASEEEHIEIPTPRQYGLDLQENDLIDL